MIYFIQCVDRIKIGFSGKPLRRLAKIASDVPYPPTLLGVMEGTLSDERKIHREFSADRCHGEWFQQTEKLTSFIVKNATVDVRQGRQPVSEIDRVIRSLGLTDAEFGAKIGVSQSQVSRIKHGKTAPSLAVIVAIEKETKGKVSAKDIFEAVKAVEAAE